MFTQIHFINLRLIVRAFIQEYLLFYPKSNDTDELFHTEKKYQFSWNIAYFEYSVCIHVFTHCVNMWLHVVGGISKHSSPASSQFYRQGVCEQTIQTSCTYIQQMFLASVTRRSDSLFLSDQEFPVNMVNHSTLSREQAR